MVSYSDSGVDWYFDTYIEASRPAYQMNDNELRTVLKWRTKLHSMEWSCKNIDELLVEFFTIPAIGTMVYFLDTGGLGYDYSMDYYYSIGFLDALRRQGDNSLIGESTWPS
jgi:hypothetical protein